MADIQRKVVNGVNTVVMHGKNYVEVAERVRLVHEQKREFEVIESSPLSFGERCIWRVVVKVDGKIYTGNAEVKLNARTGPDATNPFECGETSALGRALAFAGFGSVESIASFDEVYRATNGNTEGNTGQSTARATNAHTNKTDPKPENKNIENIPSARKLFSEIDQLKITGKSGSVYNRRDVLALVFRKDIDDSKGAITIESLMELGTELSPEYCQRLDQFLARFRKAKADVAA